MLLDTAFGICVILAIEGLEAVWYIAPYSIGSAAEGVGLLLNMSFCKDMVETVLSFGELFTVG